MPSQLTTTRTIAVVVSALGLLSACGIGVPNSTPPPPPPPSLNLLSLSSTRLQFEAAPGTSSAHTITITNLVSSPLPIDPLRLVSNGGLLPFHQSSTCGKELAADSSCTVTITFSPARAGVFAASLKVTVEHCQPQTVLLEARSTAATEP